MINSYSTATVFGDSRVGGLVGSNDGNLTQCYSTGTVVGNDDVGGLVGRNYYGNITSSYSTGSVAGSEKIGGLVGRNKRGSITSSYSTGTVTGRDRIGGLVGDNYQDGSIISSFYDIQISGQTNICGRQQEGAAGCVDSYGKSTAEMQKIGTFLEAGWDFINESTNGTEDIWWIIEGQDYPRLWWEAID